MHLGKLKKFFLGHGSSSYVKDINLVLNVSSTVILRVACKSDSKRDVAQLLK